MLKLLFFVRPLFFSGLIAITFFSCSKKEDYKEAIHNPLLFTAAMHKLNYVVIYDIFTPPVAARVFAYSNLAAYEVLAKEGNHFQSLEGEIKDLDKIPVPVDKDKIDFPFASLIAFSKVGQTLTFSKDTMQQLIDSIKTLAVKNDMPEEMMKASIRYGEQVGDSILAWSKKDNYTETRSARFSVTGLEGHWSTTPPGYFDAVEPMWATIRCLVMDSANHVPVPGPPPFSTDTASAFYKMAKDVMDSVSQLSETNKAIANFWDCNSFKLHVSGHTMFATKAMTPCGHWMEIAGIISKQHNANFYQTVRTSTGVSLGIFDAFIASWYCKYKWDLIRPETYINKYIDQDWKPYLQTPPFPEYNSAHSAISSAAATILTHMYGDNMAFTDSCEKDWGWPPRHFKSLDEAALEVSMSRLYGGIHYRNGVMDAYKQGKTIGNLVADKLKIIRE
jgi:hypothetical protein